MKKTITREVAVILGDIMAKMKYSHISEEMVEDVMNNFFEFNRVAVHCNSMTDELRKRLFDGVDEAAIKEYSEASTKMNAEELEKAFPAIYPLAVKFNKVYASIHNKEVEVELTEIDKTEFVKGVMKGTPNITASILDNFGIMYKQATEEDFSELDELLK